MGEAPTADDPDIHPGDMDKSSVGRLSASNTRIGRRGRKPKDERKGKPSKDKRSKATRTTRPTKSRRTGLTHADVEHFRSELVTCVDDAVEGVRQLVPRVESLWPIEMGRVSAMTMSATRCDGLIGHEVVRIAVDEQPHLVVVDGVTLPITTRALATMQDVGLDGLDGIELTIDGPVDHNHTPDLVVIDLRTATAWHVEVKRGGRLGCQHRRRLIADVAAGSLLVRDALQTHGYKVQRGRACAVVLGDEGELQLPAGMGLTLREFDDRFGTRASELIVETRRRHRAGLCGLLAPHLQAAASEAAVEAQRALTEGGVAPPRRAVRSGRR